MPNKRRPIALTIIVVLLAVLLLVWVSPSQYSAIGSLFAAVGGIVAVIWFYESLQHQSVQLREQREEFLKEFTQLREQNRRSALTFCRDILTDAEEKALRVNDKFTSVSGILSSFQTWSANARVAVESRDPEEVLRAVETSAKWETPAVFLVDGIKQAGEIYFRSIGNDGIDYSADPEIFVLAYESWLCKLPYFGVYYARAHVLCHAMAKAKRIREATKLALWVAMMKNTPNLMKEDEIREDIRRFKEKGWTLPAIAEDVELDDEAESNDSVRGDT